MEAWLSWLEHTVHIREVTGSSPVASTNIKTLLNSRVFLLLLVEATGLEGAFRTAHIMCPVPFGHTARSALKCKHFRSADERVLPIHHTQPERLFRLFFVFRSIVLAQSVARNKIQDNA